MLCRLKGALLLSPILLFTLELNLFMLNDAMGGSQLKVVVEEQRPKSKSSSAGRRRNLQQQQENSSLKSTNDAHQQLQKVSLFRYQNGTQIILIWKFCLHLFFETLIS